MCPWYPASSGSSDVESPLSFESPTMGRFMESQRLRECDTQLDPKARIKMHKNAIGFHKKQAEKAGIDSDVGHAHIGKMHEHMDGLKKAKEEKAAQPLPEPVTQAPPEEQLPPKDAASGKSSPVPVPKKSQQPSNDIKQDKPSVPLKKLQQGKEKGKSFESRVRRFGKEALSPKGPQMGLKRTLPKEIDEQEGDNRIYRGSKQHMRDARDISREAGKVSSRAIPQKREAGYVAPRYDKSHDEGFESPETKGVKQESGSKRVSSLEGKKGWTSRQRSMHSNMGKTIAQNSLRSK